MVNALRGHLAEHGVVIPQGTVHPERLRAALDDEAVILPEAVKEYSNRILSHISDLQEQIDLPEKEIVATLRNDDTAARLISIPDVGFITVAAIFAFVPDPSSFRQGRDFSVWMGLAPKQHPSGAKIARGVSHKWPT